MSEVLDERGKESFTSLHGRALENGVKRRISFETP
jgi:hypothetical protein